MVAELAVAVPIGLTGLVAVVLMRGELTSLGKQVEKKADTTTVEANQSAIIARLDRLSDQMERHIERAE